MGKFETQILKSKSEEIIMPGYIYGDDANTLIKNSYLYIQPSDVEGLSPVILQVMGMKTPLLCSDIKENKYIVKNDAYTFKRGNVSDLTNKILFCLKNENTIREKAIKGYFRISQNYNWDKIVQDHINIFNKFH